MRHFVSILIFFMISYSVPVFGQPTFTVRGGVNATTLSAARTVNLTTSSGNVFKFSPLDQGQRRRASIRIGAAVVIPAWNRLSLQFGGDYVQKGARESLRDYEVNIDYIEFSGLAIIALISPRRAPSLSILIGPMLAFKVKSVLTGLVSYQGDLPEFSHQDYGIVGGIGTQMAIFGAMTVKAELLYTRNFRPVHKTTGPPGLTNRAISFTVGLSFPFSAFRN